MEFGVPYVMTYGTAEMQRWSARNWDLPSTVSTKYKGEGETSPVDVLVRWYAVENFS